MGILRRPLRLEGRAEPLKGEPLKRGTGSAVVALLAIAWLTGCSFFGDQGPPFENWEPDLSPDGKTLVYESEVDETLELFVRTLVSGEERRLTHNEVEDWSPTWSPSGDRIAFASSRDDNVDVYVLTLDGGAISRVTTHEADDINPSWGTDNRIYFNSNRTETWEVFAVDPDGSNLSTVTGPTE